MAFSSKLQKLRGDSGLSQEQLAIELNVSRQAVSKWELGTLPDINNLVKISTYFDCTLDYLMSDEEMISLDTTEKRKKDKILIISSVGIVTSIITIILLKVLSIIFPKDFFRQAEDGSWYVGFTGFIDYYDLWILISLVYVIFLISFSVLLYRLFTRRRNLNKAFSKDKLFVIIGYGIIVGFVSIAYYRIMTSSFFVPTLEEIIIAILFNSVGVLLILKYFLRKNEK